MLSVVSLRSGAYIKVEMASEGTDLPLLVPSSLRWFCFRSASNESILLSPTPRTIEKTHRWLGQVTWDDKIVSDT